MKMASYFSRPFSFPSMPLSYMIILFFILLTMISSVNSFDYYSSCANQFSCGELRNVGFPFCGSGRPEGCSYPGMHLNCSANLTYITIKNISYLIKEVHPKNHTLKIARAEYLNGLCPSQFSSSSFNALYQSLITDLDVLDHNLFDYVSGYRNLTLFYGCNVEVARNFPGHFDCPVNGIVDTSAYPSLGALPRTRYCNFSVVVPVPSTFTVLNFQNLPALGEAVIDGFEVKWMAGVEECDECQQSGGVCGYDYNFNKTTCCCEGSDAGSRICQDDERLTNCNEAINCGSISNLKYPFWGANRAKYCGQSESEMLEVTCESNIAKLNISSVKYRILGWDPNLKNLTVARDDYWDILCPNGNGHENTTFASTMFKYMGDIQSMVLFYQCTGNLAPFNGLPKQQCTLSGGTTIQVYANTDPYFSAFVHCTYIVVIPILGSLIPVVMSGQIESAIKTGFKLELVLDKDECNNCSTSGGECGNYNGQFACFCRDGLHLSSCSDGKLIKPGSPKKNRRFIIATGLSAGGSVLVMISAMIICYRKKCFRKTIKKKVTFQDHNVQKFMKSYGSLAPRRYSYSEVKKMTNLFANKLGQGGYGIVYKASLPPDGRLVAVKLLTESKGDGEEFINEVASIGRTSHVNIVSLLGFCYERNKRALIYEFMPNGSLDKFIYKRGSTDAICNLEWKTFYQVAIGIARGLEYLHQGCNTRILHLDIKPQNILLDEDFCPKISDFGLAKICQKKESIVSLIGTRGTAGFIAPEVFSRTFGGVSHKSDVYSYGMLVLEMVGGRKNIDNGASHTSEVYFPDWIYKDLEQGNLNGNMSIIDDKNETVRKMILVSLWCIQTKPSDRPSMGKAVDMLEGPLESLPFPPKPFLSSPPRSPQQISDGSSTNMQAINSRSTQKGGSLEHCKDFNL